MSYHSITIEQLQEGYIITDNDTNKRYAEPKSQLVKRIKAIFGITDTKTPGQKIDGKVEVHVDPPAEPISLTVATDAKEQSQFVLKESPFSESLKCSEHAQGKLSWCVSTDDRVRISRKGYASMIVQLKLSDLKYLYDNPYAAPEITEAFGKSTYKNKAIILRSFLREVPYDKITSSVETKAEGKEDGTCDDISFESCANNSPNNCKLCTNMSRYEDKQKLAAKKPSPPLLKATMGV